MADDIRVKFSADASSYNKQLKELTQQNKTLKSEVDKVKSSTDQNTTSQEKAAKIAEAVQKQVKGKEEYIKALKAEYEKLSQAEGDNSTELLKQEEKINKAEAALNKMNGELADAQREADGYGTETEEATKQTQEMDEAARLLASSKLADFYNQVSEAVQKVAGAAYDAAKELDEGYDTIIKKTGATGDALGSLQSSADNVFGRLPVEMSDVGTAIGEVNTRFGLTGDELEDVSELFIKFANITDSDVNSAIGTTSRLLKTYGGDVKDANKVLGYFAKQSQLTGVDTNTLLSSLDKNGATLREMGLDLQQSTKLLALFEQNGVDSAGAMTGLRKAIVNGAKEGKSFDQVLREASDSIKSASSDTEALQIATELFGTKGAVVMADGLRSGRISIDDLAESMETYGDVVGDTFEATLDPWDKAKVAMNNLKVAGSELAGEALSAIAPLLDKVVDLVQKAVKWFKDLPEPVKKVVAVVGMLGAGAGVAFPKVQSLFQTLSMFKAATAIKGLSGVSGATGEIAKTAGKASGAMALLTNPVTLGVAAVSALGLALAGLAKHTENMIEAEYGLTEAEKEQIAAIDANHEAMLEMAAARQEAVDAASAEFGHIEALAREYDTLIDANGKVKKGYEDRANFILGELAKATGKTLEDIRAEIDENGKLKQSIYDTIDAKKAEAVLSASQSSYTDAIQKQRQAQIEYGNALALVSQREKEYAAATSGANGAVFQQIAAMEQQLAKLSPTSAEYAELAMKLDDYRTMNTEAIVAERTAAQALDESKRAAEQAGTTLAGYNSTISNYENLASAIASGSAPKIQLALENVTRGFQTAETGTRASLQQQLDDAKSSLAAMEQAFKNGAVDQTAVDMARKLVIDSSRELKKLDEVGKDGATGLSNGLKTGQKSVKTQGKALGTAGVKSVAIGAETASPSKATTRTGKDVGAGLVEGMKAKEGAAKTRGTTLGKSATTGVTTGANPQGVRAAGEKLGSELQSGIDARRPGVKTAASATATTANTSIKPSTAGVYAAGQSLGAQLDSGIRDKNGAVATAAQTVRNTAQNNLKPNATELETAGKNAVAGLVRGLQNKAQVAALNAQANNLASITAKAVRNYNMIKSPSRLMARLGEYMVEGFAQGLEETAPIAKAMSAMNSLTTPELHFGAEGINGKTVSKSLSYGDINVTVNGSGVTDETLLAKKISDQIFRQVKRESAAYA